MDNTAWVVFQRLMTIALVVSYGVAWGWPSTSPYSGLIFIAVASFLLTLPYFLAQTAKIVIMSMVVASVLALASTLFPPLAILVSIWGLICLFNKLHSHAKNIPVVLSGFLLYGIVIYISFLKSSSPFLGNLEMHTFGFVNVLMGLVGASLMVGGLWIFTKCGYRRAPSAAIMLGFVTYILLFFLTFFLPGVDDDSDFGDAAGHCADSDTEPWI